MNVIKKIYCRTFQAALRAAQPILPYREPEILRGVDEIAAVLKGRSIKSALLVTGPTVRKSGLTLPLEESLKECGIACAVFDKTCANPTVENVEEARETYLREKCECLIAFGGGSAMDCAKAAGARIARPEKSLEKLKGTLRVIKKIPLLIAVPTTAGTGSEVTLAAVITDGEKKYKYTVNDFTLIPRFAVLDPKTTFSLPPNLTATTGMDALTHAVEAFIGRATCKATREKAIEAVRLVLGNIERAHENGRDEEARANMLKAAYAAGIAFSKSYVGYVHAVAHSLGGQYNIPHGLANAVLLPIVLEGYGKSAEKKLHRLAVAAGVAEKEDGCAVGARKFIEAIRALNGRLHIPAMLDGIRAEDIPSMAKRADREANPLYPVPRLMNAEELQQFYFAAMG